MIQHQVCSVSAVMKKSVSVGVYLGVGEGCVGFSYCVTDMNTTISEECQSIAVYYSPSTTDF